MEHAIKHREPSIGDYGFLSDCQTAALVSRYGSVDWYCPPRFDSPSVFGRLLDPGAGHWSISPMGEFESERTYVKDTLALRTVFRTSQGAVAITDAMSLERGARGHEIGQNSPHVLLRQVEGLTGAVEMQMEFVPRLNYGTTTPALRRADSGITFQGDQIELRLTTPVPLDANTGHAFARFSVHAGEKVGMKLTYRSTADSPSTPNEISCDEALADTISAWHSWSDQHDGYDGAYVDEVRKSALVLQGLTYQPHGVVIAAPTTSLPERLGGEDNWDYRFVWLRDLSLVMRALWVAACPDEPERFLRWISRATGGLDDGAVQIMFGIDGERELEERTLGHLRGFRDSAPVRVGNDAWRQKQLDVLGEVVDAAYQFRDSLKSLDDHTVATLTGMTDYAANNWRSPDSGMWEARDRERHYLSSKVMCWVALDRALKLKALNVPKETAGRWRRERDQVKQAVLEQGWNENVGAFTGAFGSDHLDASVLLMPLVGFLSASDPRMRATINTVEQRLGNSGMVRRWAEEPNGFLLCGYWLAECLSRAGEIQRATEWFERTTAFGNDLGLLSEMVDPRSGELLGNFPQAFSHIGLINAAWQLSQAADRTQKKTKA